MRLELNLQLLLPYLQRIETLLMEVWILGTRASGNPLPKNPKQAISEFAYQIYVHAKPPLYRPLPDKTEIMLMENFLLDEYPFSSTFPFTREQMRQAVATEGGTY